MRKISITLALALAMLAKSASSQEIRYSFKLSGLSAPTEEVKRAEDSMSKMFDAMPSFDMATGTFTVRSFSDMDSATFARKASDIGYATLRFTKTRLEKHDQKTN